MSISDNPQFIAAIGANLIDRANAGRRATQLAVQKGRKARYQPKVGDWVAYYGHVGEVIAHDGLIKGAFRVEFYRPDGSADAVHSMRPDGLRFLGTEMPMDLFQARQGGAA